MNQVTSIKVMLGERVLTLTGRKAWALHALIEAGPHGLTTLTNPAPRWSQYALLLRRDGFVIETRTEMHGGPFAGKHGRYVLTSPVNVLDIVRNEQRRAA